MSELSHLNSSGEARMVDISQKGDTLREATASGRVVMKPETLEQIKAAKIKKGDVLAVARVAGIMAAKKTPDLIPLCHPIMIDEITVKCFRQADSQFLGRITAILRLLVQRKLELYPDNERYLLGYEFSESGGKRILNVISIR